MLLTNFYNNSANPNRIFQPFNQPYRYQDVIQYSCPEGYVFEIYQDFPNFTINWGLVEDEQSEINLTCASYGDWLPLSVPRCIKTNCTEDPIKVEMNNFGEYDWDGFNKSFEWIIKYSCPKAGNIILFGLFDYCKSL